MKGKKKKILTVLMTVVVILIWGKLIYDFVDLSGNDENVVMPIISMNAENVVVTEKFRYEISGDYRDPFLGKSSNSTLVKTPVKKTAKKVKQQPKPSNVVWPKIIYRGGTKASNQTRSTAFLEINGNQFLMGIGDLKQGIEIINMKKDSIVLKFNEELKTIKTSKK